MTAPMYRHTVRAQELCESRGGRPGLPVPNKPTVSVDVKQHSTRSHIRAQELCESRGGRPGLPVPNKPTVSVDVKQHFNNDKKEERGVERGSARRSSLKGRARAIVSQTNIGTVSKAKLGKLLRDGWSE